MGGLKPVENSSSSKDNNDGAAGSNDAERVTFGVIDGMAYVVYEDGRVDVGADGKAVRMPAKMAKKIAEDYQEFILD